MGIFYASCRIISEFEAIREHALTKPEDTREMIDMLKFVEEAKTKTLVKLDSDIKVNRLHSIMTCSKLRLYFLLHCIIVQLLNP